MIEQIRELETIACRLEPEASERKDTAQAIMEYAETFLRQLPQAPTYYLSQEDRNALYASPIAREGMDIRELLELLKNHVDNQGLNTPSPRFLAFIPGGALYYSALGDYLADVTNRYSGLFFGSPGAVRIEKILLQWMASIVGYPASSAGNLTSGGSIANLSAIVTARESTGLKARDYPKAVVYLTDQYHYSITKALRIAGLQECILRLMPVDAHLRMHPAPLTKMIRRDRQQGFIPWLVVAAAGTTNTGAVDPLEAISDIAEQNQLWMHADGAYGAFFALVPEGKRILRGMEQSHSITLDPHKGLFLPYGTGGILVRDGQKLYRAFNAEGSYHQELVNSLEVMDPKDLSPELSRPFRGLRLWLPLKLLGTRPFEAALEEKMLLARYFYTEIQKLEGVEVIGPPDLSIVPFRFVPLKGDADLFNRQIVDAIRQDGRIILSSTMVNGRYMIRMAILGVRTHLDTVELALEILRNKSRTMKE